MIIANVHIQVVNWRDTVIILWIWSFSFSQLTRYHLSYSARTLFMMFCFIAIWFYMFLVRLFHSLYYTFLTRKGWVHHSLPSKKLWNTWAKVQGINSCYIWNVYHMVETTLYMFLDVRSEKRPSMNEQDPKEHKSKRRYEEEYLDLESKVS